MIKPVNVVAQPAGFGDPLVNQQGVVTMHGTVDMNAFAMEFINAIAAHRHWSRYGMA
jgi:hypothetical protein